MENGEREAEETEEEISNPSPNNNGVFTEAKENGGDDSSNSAMREGSAIENERAKGSRGSSVSPTTESSPNVTTSDEVDILADGTASPSRNVRGKIHVASASLIDDYGHEEAIDSTEKNEDGAKMDSNEGNESKEESQGEAENENDLEALKRRVANLSKELERERADAAARVTKLVMQLEAERSNTNTIEKEASKRRKKDGEEERESDKESKNEWIEVNAFQALGLFPGQGTKAQSTGWYCTKDGMGWQFWERGRDDKDGWFRLNEEETAKAIGSEGITGDAWNQMEVVGDTECVLLSVSL